MLAWIKATQRVFFPTISTDERVIFGLVSTRLPIDQSSALEANVSSVKRARESEDRRSIVYEIDLSLLKSAPNVAKLAPVSSSPSVFIEIHVGLYGAIQPFTILVKDGILHSLVLGTPYRGERVIEEFDVIKFKWCGSVEFPVE